MSTLQEIIAASCKVGQVPRAYLLGRRQDGQVRAVRTLVVAVALRKGKLHSHIGRAMHRHRSTVTHYKQKIDGMRGEAKAALEAQVAEVERRLTVVSREASATDVGASWR